MLIRTVSRQITSNPRVCNRGAGEAAALVVEDGARDGDAPDAAKVASEAPDARGRGDVALVEGRLDGGQEHAAEHAAAEGVEKLDADPGGVAGAGVEEAEEAEGDGCDGEAGEVEGLVAAGLGEQDASEDGEDEAAGDVGERVDSRAQGREAPDCLEVDGEEVVDPVGDDGVDEGQGEGGGRGAVRDDLAREGGLWAEARRPLEGGEEEDADEAEDEGHDDVVGAPAVDGAAPGECHQGGHDGGDEDGVAGDVDASEACGPGQVAVILDAEEDEEDPEGGWSMC